MKIEMLWQKCRSTWGLERFGLLNSNEGAPRRELGVCRGEPEHGGYW